MLRSLEIKNFRVLENFHVERLGRVNLIVGKNSSGKSTVLEALRVYAGNAQRGLLETLAESHDEKILDSDRAEPDSELPFQDLFSGRRFPENDNIAITIGDPASQEPVLRIEHVFLLEYEEALKEASGITETTVRRRVLSKSEIPTLSQQDNIIRQAIMTSKGDFSSFIFIDRNRPRRIPREVSGELPCSFIPTQFVSGNDLARLWDRVALTEHEATVKQALRCIAPEFEGLAFIGEMQRIPKARMSGFPRPIPLNSLGDGMVRVLQLILHVFPAKGGFLIIDEFENGLHYTVQENIWALIFDLAEQLDIQVFATTHGWDCVESFSRVAVLKEKADAVLFRVGKSELKSNYGAVISTIFDKEQLHNITQMDVEVR